MFTYSKLGDFGDFGNQLFEVAATIGLAVKHGQDYVFPAWQYQSYFRDPVPQSAGKLEPDIVVGQFAFHYLDIRLSTSPSCLIDLRGHFQSERYFLPAEDLVRTHFAPHPSIVDQILAQHEQALSAESSCIIVVRRGDYAQFPHQHPMMAADYYSRAMCLFPPDTTFIVTSDDIDWCRRHLRAANITYLPQSQWRLNFFIGTMCRHAIISNTTFGWWIAWLNAHVDRRVIAPKEWFGPALAHHRTDDLLPPQWVTI
jgi:hypothetical protein